MPVISVGKTCVIRDGEKRCTGPAVWYELVCWRHWYLLHRPNRLP